MIQEGNTLNLPDHSFEWRAQVHLTIDQIRYKGSLVQKYNPLYNFIEDGKQGYLYTDKLGFDLQHSVQMEVLDAYDGSANLIITDGHTTPKMINSKFAPRDNETFEIIEREGKSDTSLYHSDNFDVETSLTKKYSSIPNLQYLGFTPGGSLPCGNYHFFIKYADADGNTSDFIAESGLVSVFLGQDGDPTSVHGGIRDTDSGKGVLFKLTNLDTGYSYIKVFFERDSSDDQLNRVSIYKLIDKTIPYSDSELIFNITGFENVSDSTEQEINSQYVLFDSAKTMALAKNRLFMANVNTKPMYERNLKDICMQFLPYVRKYKASDKIGSVNYLYISDKDIKEDALNNIYPDEYYNSKNIYYNLGYADGEIYRLGVVFIQSNGQLTSVYNVRGTAEIPVVTGNDLSVVTKSYDYIQWNVKYKYTPDGETEVPDTLDQRIYYDFPESGYIRDYQNTHGVIYINDKSANDTRPLYGLGMYVSPHVLDYLKSIGIKGFFVVRQKRMPMRLCQAYTLPVDSGSQLPVLHTEDGYYTESFLDDTKKLSHSFNRHLREVPKQQVTEVGAICPDYMVKMPYLNQFFTGTQFYVKESKQHNSDECLTNLGSNNNYTRQFYVKDYNFRDTGKFDDSAKIVSLQDSAPIASAGDTIFRAKAGEMEEVFRYRLTGNDLKLSDAGSLTNNQLKDKTTMVRGLYSPYLGIETKKIKPDSYIDIYFPGYDPTAFKGYFDIRMQDTSQYYSVSERYDLSEEKFEFFGGDNYLCTFTWRMNRNFSDSTAPTNDTIIDPDTWKDNFDPSKMENFSKINRGDINAVKLGAWITLRVESQYNLNLRSIDESHTSEALMYGHGRGFYPVMKATADGGYKIPDTQQQNDGYNSTVGNRWYMRYPEVPYVISNYSNRIYYSNIGIHNSIQNGYRVFESTNFRDYNSELGSITKIVEWYGDIVAVMEHGVVYIPIQEKSLASDNSDVYLNYKRILPEAGVVISQDIGSKWIDSVVKTAYGIFGVDTCAKKIWKISGSGQPRITIISDFKVESFLNANLTVKSTDNTPYFGIRDVRSFFDIQKQEIMFTVYDWPEVYKRLVNDSYDSADINLYIRDTGSLTQWNLAYNMLSSSDGGLFTTFYSWIPGVTFNIDNRMYSTDIDWTRHNVMLTDTPVDKTDTINGIWRHGEDQKDIPEPTFFYNRQEPFEFEFVAREDPSQQKIWENLYIISNMAEPESFSFTIVGDSYNFSADKPTMYYRQEAAKEMWHKMGSLIQYDPNYTSVKPEHHNVSAYLPLYYRRDKNMNRIACQMQDCVHTACYDFQDMSGSEILKNRDKSFDISTHIKCLTRSGSGILRCNSEYMEDVWKIQIPRINVVYKNEPLWDKPPIVVDYVPNDITSLDIEADTLPEQYGSDKYWPRNLDTQKWTATKQLPVRDKWIRIRIRYSGRQLAVISAIRTVYTQSFS